MINKKKLDELDLVFINKPRTEVERKSFSVFLKARKATKKQKKVAATDKKQLV